MNSDNFDIVKEVYGNNIDKELVKSTILDNISKGEFNLYYSKKEFYDNPEAVSYTHLDVYKRQTLDRLPLKEGGRWGRRQIIMPLTTWATHVLQWSVQRVAKQ